MIHETETLLAEVQQGKLTRREASRRLLLLAAATFGAVGSGCAAQGAQSASTADSAESKPTFQSEGLNHIALRVTDLNRSRDFYGRHLGLEVLRQSPYNCFLRAGGNHFVALFRSDTPGLDHYCYTVPNYEAGAVVETLKGAGLEPRRTEDRVYFDDPDGIEVQLASTWGDYPGGRP
ncbi:hypothetical protein ABI59_13210 [Acidobacteria bacterium Mor1]|nr:hypothetical protein ABI59_13210 [Acidobacteria bacterium Mor1]